MNICKPLRMKPGAWYTASAKSVLTFILSTRIWRRRVDTCPKHQSSSPWNFPWNRSLRKKITGFKPKLFSQTYVTAAQIRRAGRALLSGEKKACGAGWLTLEFRLCPSWKYGPGTFFNLPRAPVLGRWWSEDRESAAPTPRPVLPLTWLGSCSGSQLPYS